MTSKLAARGSAEDIRLYTRRWILMAVFIYYTISCGVHWVEFTSITNVVTRYYGVSAVRVEWTTIIYMVSYTVCVVPTLYLIDRIGVKSSLILAAVGTGVGGIIKCFSVSPDRFYLVMIGQTFEGVFTSFTYGLVGRFTALWFGSQEISLAGGLTLLGDQCGSALSFLIPSLLVQDVPNIEVVEQGMMRMHLLFSAIGIVCLLLVIFFFKGKPKVPPSFAQIKQSEEVHDVGKCIIKIFTNPSFLMISFSYGIAVATSSAFAVMLNQLIEINFKEHIDEAGKIGFGYMLSGMVSSIICSHILDQSRHFKGNAVILSLTGTLSLAMFTVVSKLDNIILVYIATASIGFFLQGYYATGMQMGIELTFPVPESIVASSMCLFVQITSIILTSAYGFAIRQYGDMCANIGLTCGMLVSFVLACLIPANLKREKVEKRATGTELIEFITKS